MWSPAVTTVTLSKHLLNRERLAALVLACQDHYRCVHNAKVETLTEGCEIHTAYVVLYLLVNQRVAIQMNFGSGNSAQKLFDQVRQIVFKKPVENILDVFFSLQAVPDREPHNDTR